MLWTATRCLNAYGCPPLLAPQEHPSRPLVTEEDALATFGGDTVYYATRLRGASNEKAKDELHFRARPLEWLYS